MTRWTPISNPFDLRIKCPYCGKILKRDVRDVASVNTFTCIPKGEKTFKVKLAYKIEPEDNADD